MAKKATKKAPAQGGVMEQLAAYSPPYEDAPVEKDPVKEQGEQVKSLTEQLAKLQTQLDGYQRQDAYRSFQSAQVVQEAGKKPAAPPKTSVDLTGLPDPVAETEKWQAEMARRINEAVENRDVIRQSEAAVAQEQAALTNNLWAGFKTAHPDWAQHELLVEAAAGRVSQGLMARGVDVVKVMKQQPELFYGEVAAVLDKQYPQLKGKADEEDGDEGGDEPAVAEVFGGQAGGKGGSLVQQAVSSEDDNKAWMRELGEWRVKNGVR